MGLFSDVEIKWVENDTVELTGSRAVRERHDRENKGDLKKLVEHRVENAQCPECGGKLKGKYTAYIGKVKLFDEHQKKGMFGKAKTVSKHRETLWRLHSFQPQKLKCKSCKEEFLGRRMVEELSAEVEREEAQQAASKRNRDQRDDSTKKECNACGWRGSGKLWREAGDCCPRCSHGEYSVKFW